WATAGAVAARGRAPNAPPAAGALLCVNNHAARPGPARPPRRIAPAETTSIEDAVARGYRIALTREPTKAEQADSVAFVKSQLESYRVAGQKDAKELALTDFCQVLMCLNEFVYVD